MKVWVLEDGDHDSPPLGVYTSKEKLLEAIAVANKKAGWERYQFESYGTFYTEIELDAEAETDGD